MEVAMHTLVWSKPQIPILVMKAILVYHETVLHPWRDQAEEIWI